MSARESCDNNQCLKVTVGLLRIRLTSLRRSLISVATPSGRFYMRLPALFLLALWAPIASAQPLATVENVGDPELRAGLQRAIGPVNGDGADRFRLQQHARTATQRAERYLRSEGYYAARITSRISQPSGAVLHIDLGPRFSVDMIDYELAYDGDRLPELEHSALASGEPLQAQSVLDAEVAGLVWLENNGWPDASVGERRVVVDHARAAGNVTFAYDAGAYSTYGGFEPQSAQWRLSFLQRLDPFVRGEVISRSRMQTFEQRFEALESVANATLTLSPSENGASDRRIIAALDPAPRHAAELGLSLSTSDGAGLTGSWLRRNVMDGDETLTLTVELATLRQGMDGSLRVPHWRRFNQTLTGTLGYQSEDTDAFSQQEISTGLRLSRRVNRYTSLGASARLDQASISDTTGERDIVSAAFGASLVYDSRDDALDPQSGWRGTVSVTPATAFGDTDATYVRWEIGASTYRSLGDQFVIAARVRAGGLTGADTLDVPADERFYAGGGGSVRGFEYQSLSPRDVSGALIGGQSLTELTAEIRWRGEGRWGATAFVDAGAAEAGMTPSFSELNYAAGFGARYYLGFAPLRVDVAFPLSGESDDPQLYISFGQAF